jgi:hypothetical protein
VHNYLFTTRESNINYRMLIIANDPPTIIPFAVPILYGNIPLGHKWQPGMLRLHWTTPPL